MNPSGITLASLLNTAVHTVTPDTPIDQALALMSSHRISCVVVVDHDTPVGIFTEQDSVALLARGKYEVLLPIRSVMREPLLVSRLSMEHHRAYQMMVTRNTRHLVAVDADGRLLGLVTEGDLLHVIGLEQLIQPKSVADAMTRQVVSHDENDTLSAAAQHMTERALSCVVVTRGGLPVGMLSARDAVRLSQGGTVPESTLLSQIMSQPLLTVVADELLAVAMRHMETAGVRRLVVVDGKNRLVGLIPRHDIVKTLQEHYLDSLRDTICRLERDLDATRNRLQSVEHRLLERSVLDQVNDAVLVIELDTGRVVEANELAHEFLGQRHDQLLNLHGYDFLELFLDENAWREWAQSFPERSMQLEETRLRMQGGSWLPVEASLRHVRSEGRAFVVLVARDITERKAQEARIRLDREQQRALREILEIGIGDGDLKDRLGRCLDRLLSVSWLNLLPKAGIFDLPADGGGLRLVAQRNLPGELLVRCARVPLGVCLCGRAAQLGATQFSHCVDQRHDIAFPGMADHGHYNLPLLAGEEVLGVLVLYLPHDHPHLRAEQEFLEATADALAILLRRDRVEAALVENRNRLADSESRIRELLDSTAEAIFAVDLDDRCTLVNRACLNMLGYAQPEELLGQRIHELIHHHHADGRFYPAEACKALPSQLGLQCTRVHVDDEVFWHRDGSQIPVEYWSHPILRDGRLAGAAQLGHPRLGEVGAEVRRVGGRACGHGRWR